MKRVFLSVVILLGMVGCTVDKEKVGPVETNGFSADDMDKGQNNMSIFYPHVDSILINPTGIAVESPWVFYITFDKAMDTSVLPELKLQEVTYHNEITSNYVDTLSIKWLNERVLSFKTSPDFSPYNLVDLPFNPDADGGVYSIAIQDDGKILIGGAFTNVGGVPRNYIARLNSDGSVDTTFDPDADGNVYSIAIQDDGKILIGGWFTNVGGVPRNYIARLNSDGSVDTFDPNADDWVFSIGIQDDGKILIGGWFTNVGGFPRNRIARLNSDGSVDGFNPNANGSVDSIAIQADGKILIGGDFTSVGGFPRNYIARLNSDGSVDTFDPNANDGVSSIAIQADGKILIGGWFTDVGGVPRNYIARLNSDGSVDTFDPNANSWVDSIAIQADGKILIGGTFTNVGGFPRNYIARLNSDGSVDTTFDPNANGDVYSITIQNDGKILIGGAFTNVGGVPRNYIARLKRVCLEGNPDRYCDNYLLTIPSGTTKSVLGIELDGNYGTTSDDLIDAPSDYEDLLSNLPTPSPFPAGFSYDLQPASAFSKDAGDYLTPTLSDADEPERIHVGFDFYINIADINTSNIEIYAPDGSKITGDWQIKDPTTGDFVLVQNAKPTEVGNIDTYYDNFYFRPMTAELALGRYIMIIHCNSIHKFPITDPANNVFQRELTCNDGEPDGIDNDLILEFYVTPDGEPPPVTNRVWAVYSSDDIPLPNIIDTNQIAVFFQTPDPMDNLMDPSTLIPQNISLQDWMGNPLSVTSSVQTIIYNCSPHTVWVISAGKDKDLTLGGSLMIKYSVKDEEGNTLDGNEDGIYELSINDNFYELIPLTNIPEVPPNYLQVQDVYTKARNPKNYSINDDEVIIAFSTPSIEDDRIDLDPNSISDDDLILAGAGDPDRPNCTCDCPGGDCGGDVSFTTFEDSFDGVPTTLWKVKFTNVPSCVVKDCSLEITGGSLTADNNRPMDVCGNWLYPSHTVDRLP